MKNFILSDSFVLFGLSSASTVLAQNNVGTYNYDDEFTKEDKKFNDWS